MKISPVRGTEYSIWSVEISEPEMTEIYFLKSHVTEIYFLYLPVSRDYD